MVKDADRRKRDQREGRQRGVEGASWVILRPIKRRAGPASRFWRMQGRTAAARTRRGATYRPRSAAPYQRALSSLLMARSKDDTDKALEALKTLGKLKRAAPPTPPPLVYDIPDVLQAQVCGVYVTPVAPSTKLLMVRAAEETADGEAE